MSYSIIMKKPISTILKSDQSSREIEIGNNEGRRDWEERNRDQTDSASSALFDRKIEIVTEGLIPYFSKIMNELSHDNAMILADYITAMKTEINPSQNYRKRL